MMKPIPKGKAPSLVIQRAGAGEWSLADQRPGKFLLPVFYRGHHCPICKSYLKEVIEFVEFILEKDYPARGEKTD
jgi:hypothetical protein